MPSRSRARCANKRPFSSDLDSLFVRSVPVTIVVVLIHAPRPSAIHHPTAILVYHPDRTGVALPVQTSLPTVFPLRLRTVWTTQCGFCIRTESDCLRAKIVVITEKGLERSPPHLGSYQMIKLSRLPCRITCQTVHYCPPSSRVLCSTLENDSHTRFTCQAAGDEMILHTNSHPY